MIAIYKDIQNTVFNSAKELKEKGISGQSISTLDAQNLIEAGEYKKNGNFVLRGDSDIRLHENKMLMWISRDGGHFQTIAIKKPTENMPAE
jgi:hypothetical protein